MLDTYHIFGGYCMKSHLFRLGSTLGQLEPRHIRLALAVVSLALLVLVIGAPAMCGDQGS